MQAVGPATTQDSIIHIACVVESSFALASEWNQVLTEYVLPLLKRLVDSNPGYKFRVAFITYGTADIRPTPLLAKRFFSEPQSLFKEMREEPHKLAIGHTISGAQSGMAALEGLVAAIELFDILHQQWQQKDNVHPPIYHIFHIAASPPDASERPLCNETTILDNTSWQTLPSEFKKRNINLSVISLRPLPKFAELHTQSAAGGVVRPWFPTKSAHHVLLSGFTSLTAQKAIKRPGDPPNTPEQKRLKPSQSENASPKPVNTGAQAVPSSTPTTSAAQPPARPASRPALPQLPAPPSNQSPNLVLYRQQIAEQRRNAGAQLQSIQNAVSTALAAGDPQQAEALKQQWTKLNQSFRQTIARYAQIQAQQAQQVRSMNQGDGQTQVSGKDGPSPMPAQKPASPAAVDQDPAGVNVANPNVSAPLQTQVPPNVAQVIQHKRAASASGLSSTSLLNMGQSPASGPSSSPQMQKFMEASQRSALQPQPGAGAVPNAMLNQVQAGIKMETRSVSGPATTMTASPTMSQPQPSSGFGEPSVSPMPAKTLSMPVWQGVLTWSGLDPATQDKKDVSTHVIASTNNVSECRADTWPSTLTLTPTREHAATIQDLREWMSKYKPVLCPFQPQPRIADTKTNEHHYKSLVQLLSVKNIYALGAWTLPNGDQRNNVLIFPINRNALVGAFFPITGIPELPKPSAPGPSLGPNVGGLTIPPAILAQLANMSTEQRNAVVGSLIRQRQLQRAQQQQQGVAQHSQQQQLDTTAAGLQFHNNTNMQQSPAYQNKNLLLAPANSTPPAPSSLGVVGFGMNFGGQHGSTGGRPMGGAGAPSGNLNPEMLQSFMQRNVDTSGTGG